MRIRGLFVISLIIPGLAGFASHGISAEDKLPATRAQAAAVIDLAELPLLGATQTNAQNLAELSYLSSAKVAEAFAFHSKQLTGKGFAELPGATVTDQYATAVFHGKDYRIVLSVFPSGASGTIVTISNQGNLGFEALPVPPMSKELFKGPSNIMYDSEMPVPEMNADLDKKFAEAGWKPYGTAGPIRFFKKNAVLVTIMTQAAPAQGGKTVVDFQTRLMSAEIDAPPDAKRIAYAEATKTLDLDTDSDLDGVAEFYRSSLGAQGWKPTTDKPVKEKFDSFWIFRNDAKEMVELKLRKLGTGSRILIKFMTAADVREENRKAEEFAAKKAMTKPKGKPELTVTKPKGIQKWTVSPNGIVAVAETGRARAAAVEIRENLLKSGWKVTTEVLEPIAGTVVLAKGDASLSIVYDDTGVTPAELTVSVTGMVFAAGEAPKRSP